MRSFFSPLTVDSERIRDKSIREAKRLDINVPATLPLLDAGLETRNADETISRILAMHAVAASAYGFDKAKAILWLNQEGLTDLLSKQMPANILKTKPAYSLFMRAGIYLAVGRGMA